MLDDNTHPLLCSLLLLVQTGEDEVKLIAACPCEHHPYWGDNFFTVWELLFMVSLFTD
jgi:hypothetical protein